MLNNSLIISGDYTYGLEGVQVHSFGEGARVVVGKFCCIASNVSMFLGGDHRTDWITTYPFGHRNVDLFAGTEIKGHPKTNGDIVIGNDVWIGTGATIMSGVTIGDGVVVAANSHVVDNLPSYSLCGGNPAQLIKYRFDVAIINLLEKLKWWDLPPDEIRKVVPILCNKPTVETLVTLVNKYRS